MPDPDSGAHVASAGVRTPPAGDSEAAPRCPVCRARRLRGAQTVCSPKCRAARHRRLREEARRARDQTIRDALLLAREAPPGRGDAPAGGGRAVNLNAREGEELMGTETPITPTEQEIREVIALKWASGGLAEPGDWVRKATEGDQETLAQVRSWRGLITRYRRREGEEEAREHIARVVSEMDAWIAREPERRAEQEERAREDEWRR